jgi:hypothetical protein
MADYIPKPTTGPLLPTAGRSHPGPPGPAGGNGKEHMEASRTATLTIVGLPTENPSTVMRASRVPTRLLIRNIGPTTLRLAYVVTALTGSANDGTDHYQIPSGGEDVFILAPQQGFYAVSVGAGGQLSYASSDALPVVFPGGGAP